MFHMNLKWMTIDTVTSCSNMLLTAMFRSVLLITRSPTVIGPMSNVPMSIVCRLAWLTSNAGTFTCTTSPSKLEVHSQLRSGAPPGGERIVGTAHRGAEIG